jgi:hypothetical protein
VQVFDQEVALARLVAQQGLHFGQGLRVDAAAFWGFALALAGGSGSVVNACDGDDGVVHGSSRLFDVA